MFRTYYIGTIRKLKVANENNLFSETTTIVKENALVYRGLIPNYMDMQTDSYADLEDDAYEEIIYSHCKSKEYLEVESLKQISKYQAAEKLLAEIWGEGFTSKPTKKEINQVLKKRIK